MTETALEKQTAAALNPDLLRAYPVLAGEPLSEALAFRLGQLSGPDILDLASLAHKVRIRYAPSLQLCTILNAKSGACTENCRFCSQSSHHSSGIEVYPLLSPEAMLAAADRAYAHGVRTFGLVTSGAGYGRVTPEVKQILDTVTQIRNRYADMEVCASVGMISAEVARALAECGIGHFNINLQVDPGRYAELISTTHAAQDRIQTIRELHAHGIGVCSGGILGVGESMDDRIRLALALRTLDPDVIPLNVLLPIAGTALEHQPFLPVSEVVKTFAIFRLLHPAKTIKFAAGRETRMKDFQGLLMLSGANGFLTGGYLTTRGRDTEEDQSLARDLRAFGA